MDIILSKQGIWTNIIEKVEQNLTKTITYEIKKNGNIKFSKFMEMALYTPYLGYYSQENKWKEYRVAIQTIGDNESLSWVEHDIENLAIPKYLAISYETTYMTDSQSNSTTVAIFGKNTK